MNPHDRGWRETLAAQQKAAGLPGKPMAILFAIGFVIGLCGLFVAAGYIAEGILWVISLF